MRRILIPAVVLAAIVAAFASQAGAALTCTTSTVKAGAWTDGTVWSDGAPGAGSVACVKHAVTLPGSATAAGLSVTSTLTVDGSLSVTGESELSGTLAGTGTVTLGGTTTWSGGTMTGAGTTTSTGTLRLTGYTSLDAGRTLVNAGTLEGATSNRYVSGSNGARIRNTGTIRMAAGIADVGLRAPVENDGTVVSDAGELYLSQGGSGSTGSYGGGTGRVELSGGVHAVESGAKLLGNVELTTGELSGPIASTGANAIGGGTVKGDLSVDTGTLTWSGGTMQGPGTTTVKAPATLRVTGYTTLTDRALANAGALEMALSNRYVTGNGTAAVRNTGTIRVAAGVADAGLRVPVENDGTVVSDAGVLYLSQGGSGSAGSYGGGTGAVQLTGGTHAVEAGAKLLGGVELTTGELSGPVVATGSNEIGGGTVSGALSLDSGTMTWSAGTMKGPATTTVKTGATLRLAGYGSLSEARQLANAGTLDLAVDGRYISASGAGTKLLNTGTIKRTAAGTSGSDLRVPVENDGTILAETGALTLTEGATGSSGTFGGGAGTVRFASKAIELETGAALAGVAVNGPLTIPTGVTVAMTGASTLLGSGNIGGAGTLNVASGTLAVEGGRMSGTGTTSLASGVTTTLTNSLQLLDTRALRNAGTILVTSNHAISPSGAGTPTFLNQATGVLRKTGGTGSNFVSVAFTNLGTVDSQSGEIFLTRGGEQAHTGVFKGSSATDHVLIGGTGHVLASAARLEDHTAIAGDVKVREGDTLTISEDVVQDGGTLSGDVSVTGTLTWRGGLQKGPGTTTIQPAGQVLVDPEEGDSCGNAVLDDGRTLLNNGVLRVLDGAQLGTNGDPRPIIENEAKIELDSAGQNCGGYTGIVGEALVHNAATGTIEKLGGAGESFVGWTLDNDGTVLASVGRLRLGSSETVGHTGLFKAAGGEVAFDEGVFVFDPGAALDGDVAVTGADVRLPEAMTLEVPVGKTLRLSAGSLGGAGEVRVRGALAWTGGAQEGPGTTSIEPGGTATLAPSGDDDEAYGPLEADRSLVNRGTFTVTDGRLSLSEGASILNRGTLVVGGSSMLTGSGFGDGYGGLIHNVGTLRKTGTSAVKATVAIDNDGTIAVDGGSLEAPALLNWTGNGFLGESGLAGGTYELKGTLFVPGPVKANGARLVLHGAGGKLLQQGFSGTTTDALAALARNAGGGELVLRNGASPALTGALLNQGTLDLAAGTTLKSAGFRQVGGALLRTAVGAGGTVGKIAATGPATLGGRLDAPVNAGVSTDLVLLTASAVSGTFAQVTGGYEVLKGTKDVRLHRPGTNVSPKLDVPASEPAPEPVAKAAPLRIDLAAAGPWQRRGAYVVAERRGATLTARRVTGRGLSLVARTCRACGAVKVTWAGRTRKVALRSRKPGRRTVRVFAAGARRTGTVRVRSTSARRVALDALLVRR